MNQKIDIYTIYIIHISTNLIIFYLYLSNLIKLRHFSFLFFSKHKTTTSQNLCKFFESWAKNAAVANRKHLYIYMFVNVIVFLLNNVWQNLLYMLYIYIYLFTVYLYYHIHLYIYGWHPWFALTFESLSMLLLYVQEVLTSFSIVSYWKWAKTSWTYNMLFPATDYRF